MKSNPVSNIAFNSIEPFNHAERPGSASMCFEFERVVGIRVPMAVDGVQEFDVGRP